ncbi:MAG: hypothetical protein ICV62_17805, partial [Cyanobacteria bacterium Co-bin13]|nr:hypothetical protein [Cyanobacteria bacterium Co-bin13]
LQEWERLRQNVEPAARHIHFLADVIGESCMPAGTDADLIWRWESLAQSLDSKLDEHFAKANTLTLAYRDLAALAAARPARILTYRSAAEQAQSLLPQICTTLTQWGIVCREIDSANPLAQLEREQLHTLLVHAGLSKFLWAGLQLVVLHLVVPMAATLNASQDWSDDYAFSEPAFSELETMAPAPANLWEGAQAFWYAL